MKFSIGDKVTVIGGQYLGLSGVIVGINETSIKFKWNDYIVELQNPEGNFMNRVEIRENNLQGKPQ